MARFGPLRSLAFVLVVGIVLLHAASLLVLVPFGKGADELEHLDYVLHLAAESRLPDPRAEAVGQIQHPPLPYVAIAGLFHLLRHRFDDLESPGHGRDYMGRRTLFDPGRREGPSETPPGTAERIRLRQATPQAVFLALRTPSLLLGVITLVFLVLAAREIRPRDPDLALWAAAALALTPHFAFHFAMLSNDPWLTVLAAVTGQRVLRGRRLGHLDRPRELILLSVLLGLGFLVKLHALALFVFVASIVLKQAGSGGRRLFRLAVLAAGPALVAGWWYLRQWRLAGGLLITAHHAQFRPDLLRLDRSNPIVYWQAATGMLESFFGVVGQDAITALPPYGAFCCGLALLALLGAIIAACRPEPAQEAASGTPEKAEVAPPRAPVVSALAAVFTLLAAVLVANRWYWHVHGRYFFGALVPLLIVFICGLERLLGHRLRGVLIAVSSWNLLFLISSTFLLVANRYSVPTAKYTRGHTVAYYDAGHEGFDQEEAGGQVAERRFAPLCLPDQTIRFAFQPTPKAELVYRFVVPDTSKRWQLRVRYPSPFPRSAGEVPAPTGMAMVVDKWMIHGPYSVFGTRPEAVLPLPAPITEDGAIEVWWQNHVDYPAGVGLAEIWLEEAWTTLRGPGRLDDVAGAVHFDLVNVDDRASHECRVFLVLGEEILASTGRLQLRHGELRSLALDLPDGRRAAPENLFLRIVDFDQAPQADVKLAHWSTGLVPTSGRIEVPDIEVLRLGPEVPAGTVLARVLMRRTLKARYLAEISHPGRREALGESEITLRVEGGSVEGAPRSLPADDQEPLDRTVWNIDKTAGGESDLVIEVVAGAERAGRVIDLDRLVLRRDPEDPRHGQVHPVTAVGDGR